LFTAAHLAVLAEIGQHEQRVAGLGHAVLHAAPAGLHHDGHLVGPIGGHEPRLGGGLVADLDGEEASGAQRPDAQPEPIVGLLEHHRGGGLGAELLAAHLPGAQRGVELAPPQGPRVVRPHDHARDIHDLLARVLSRGEIADAEGVALGPRQIDRVREPAVIGAHLHHAHAQVGAWLRELVGVEHHLLVPSPARPAAVDGIGAALLGARVVQPGAPRRGRGRVRLLDAAEHLLVEDLAQLGEVRELGVGPGVLRLEVGEDRGIVSLAQPVKGIFAAHSVLEVHVGPRLGTRR
jgi:hypothetical protein